MVVAFQEGYLPRPQDNRLPKLSSISNSLTPSIYNRSTITSVFDLKKDGTDTKIGLP